MKAKFNKFERVAGLFVFGAMGGAIAAFVGVAIQRGWFETKVQLETSLKSAEGVHIGTQVVIAGLRAGGVTQIELKSDNEVRVRFEVSEKFMSRIREDSVVHVLRPFVIGEKVIEVAVGGHDARPVYAGESLRAEPTVDLMELVSGRSLGPYLQTIAKLMDNLKFVADAFLDPKRSRAIVGMFDEMAPLLRNANSLLSETNSIVKQTNKKNQLAQMIVGLTEITAELRSALPAVREQAPQMAQDLAKIAKNMAVLTDELQKAMPMVAQMAPEIPRASKRALEALDETVVVLKALQKSFLLSGNAREVREEEAAAKQKAKASERAPAADPKVTPDSK